MLFTTNPHVGTVATSAIDGQSNSSAIPSSLDVNDLDVSPLSSHVLGVTDIIQHVLGPINEHEGQVYDAAMNSMTKSLNPEASIDLQAKFVEYIKDLTVASKVAKSASDFIKETTHVQ